MPRKESELRALLPPGVKIHLGAEGLLELATLAEADVVLIAIVGTAGLFPALAAIEAGKDLAVASKEILVMAGEIITTAARKRGVGILPVDSEHNAIFQCLDGHRGGEKEVSRLILTASGGPFRKLPAERIPHVTVAEALKHPTWDMGPKITIDSATLFNKGLEMIEARWLFGIGMERIDVVVHPQSIIHSMVEFTDGSVLAQLSRTDMCFPIQYALTWPRRVKGGLRPLDFPALAKLEFEAPRTRGFPRARPRPPCRTGRGHAARRLQCRQRSRRGCVPRRENPVSRHLGMRRRRDGRPRGETVGHAGIRGRRGSRGAGRRRGIHRRSRLIPPFSGFHFPSTRFSLPP